MDTKQYAHPEGGRQGPKVIGFLSSSNGLTMDGFRPRTIRIAVHRRKASP